MDIIIGLFLAAILLLLCVGFGQAVSTAVTRLLSGSEGNDREPPEKQ